MLRSATKVKFNDIVYISAKMSLKFIQVIFTKIVCFKPTELNFPKYCQMLFYMFFSVRKYIMIYAPKKETKAAFRANMREFSCKVRNS